MKNIKNILWAACLTFVVFSCSDILEEEPRAIYEPGFFQSEKGVQGGLTALYANTRWIFGNYSYAVMQNGTDEYTYGQQADNNFRDSDMSGAGNITPTSSRADAIWNATYGSINTASGIIENAAAVGLSNALIAEAQFWRAWNYFLLVQTFGGVPLDLGSGELKFNTSTSRTSVRNTVPEVYTKAIFPDLKTAVQNLPETGRVTGGLTKTAARLYLAKAYLTYAWWLENPNNIPTFPETPRTDPDGQTAAWYFQQAYNIAMEGIANPGPFGLLDYFYDVHLGSNDRNKEIVLYSDHIEDHFYNGFDTSGGSLSWSNGSAPESWAVWFVTWQSELLRSAASPGGSYNVQSVPRAAVQWGGRPWTRMAPPQEVFSNTFADKTNDSRFDGTFATTFFGMWNENGNSAEVMYNANGLPVRNGEVILTFLDEETPGIVFPTGSGDSGVGAGALPGRADWVIAPSGISRRVYPNLWKMGTYRTDNGSGLGQPNGALTRPWNIAKFSEFYFIAAEANVKGATATAGSSARDLINVIRARAGKWRWHNNGNVEKMADNSAAMIAATPATIDVNYILEERSREYFGEGKRWHDLVRTQTWSEIAKTYTISGNNMGDRTPATFTRTIQPHHYLRPIPQEQIDRMTMGEDEKKAYQNPGY
jgi:hypothetical protein